MVALKEIGKQIVDVQTYFQQLFVTVPRNFGVSHDVARQATVA